MPLFYWLASIETAGAFCGTFVGAPGSELTNHTSQVVIARQGDITTLTLVADYSGDLSEFALLIPVPESLEQDRVVALEPSIVDRLDRYSTPRLVQYQCSDAITFSAPGCALGGCSASSASLDDAATGIALEIEPEEADGSVTIEAQFQVAEYDVVLLSATGAGGLYDWLDENGYAIPAGGEEVIGEYIDSGSHFLAAKIHLDALPDGSSRLSPLQLRYRSPDWTLPLRIGTISAKGEQEVIIYALTELLDGDVAISNYPEGRVDDECMLPEGVEEDFGSYYHEQLLETHPEQGPAWNTEYNWTLYSLTQDTGYHCDPCTVEREELYDPGDLATLGFEDPTDGMTPSYGYGYGYGTGPVGNGALLTRLRMVYNPADIHQDLALYTKGSHEANRQIRYIRYDRRLEFLYPICGVGYVDEPGMCGDELDEQSKGNGRSAAPAVSLLAMAAFVGLLSRRKTA